MAFRAAAANYWKSSVRGSRWSFTTSSSTSPKLKAHADNPLASAEGINSKARAKRWGDFFPVYVAVGFITVSGAFGMLTGFHQMAHSPNVTLKKSRREMIPEVEEPERVAQHGGQFVKHSFFRKVAHIQNSDRQDDDPISGDAFTRPMHLESLKDAGVEVKPHGY